MEGINFGWFMNALSEPWPPARQSGNTLEPANSAVSRPEEDVKEPTTTAAKPCTRLDP